MGNDQSIQKEREAIAREANTRALLEKQRRFYEEKCRRLLQQVQTSQPANMTREEQLHVGNSTDQPMNMLYPNLNMTAPQPCSSTNINNSPSRYTVNNCVPRNVAPTSIFNNNIPRNIEPTANNPNLALDPDTRLMAMPSAPPEPSAPIQQGGKGKGAYPKQNLKIGEEYSCETCGQRLGQNIFQCTNGHSSCHVCKTSDRMCGKINCGKLITDMRNRTVEALIAEMNLNDLVAETKPPNPKRVHKVNCPNQSYGCKLFISKKELANHVKECPFNEISCPLASIFGQCIWRGRINQLVSHFIDCHPEHRQANVDTELTILDTKNSSRIVHLVAVGTFNFLVNIKVDTITQTVYMAVQFFGTTFSAAKWNYEFHIYNKCQPRRKYLYSDICLSNCVPIEEIFDNNNCTVLPISYFKTFENNGGSINYKFYIKKPVE